jgi:hypothetical protein
MTTFLPSIHRIGLAGITHKDRERQATARAEHVLAAVPKATQRLGARPTHVLCDGTMLISVEILEAGGLTVVRRARDRANKFTVDLAIEDVREPAPLGQLRML